MTAQNLVIFGASGNCGQWAAKSAIEQGYNVRVLVRPGSNIKLPDGVEIMHGEVMDADTVKRAVQGQDAVLSCLGIKRKSASNPWSPVVSPIDLAEQSARNIVAAMKTHGVKRVVSISAAGVADSWPHISPVMRLVIRSSNISVAYRDLAKMEQVYRESGLDSLALRPVTLTNGETTADTKVVERYMLSSKISRGDVGSYMVRSLARQTSFSYPTEMISAT
ncbi:NAD-dependent epimerase/dehydratase family protein [Parasedimentitalea maritima]|uniref:NAD-dependent epimerase/dehydratase family protein n=1 Tax=Parasedimentitalea maritima TaxID=2578117 RepID=A0ABY2URW5_9RHOB|nr:NAD(P)H-binding protein [Zongyanglinia marina]TLP56538.1 NAD-dependent epimerase/dehydratase family protein [Zongyanglinia marina]